VSYDGAAETSSAVRLPKPSGSPKSASFDARHQNTVALVGIDASVNVVFDAVADDLIPPKFTLA
jgi:hypothetical protein